MPRKSFKQVLMERDKMSEADADETVREAKEQLAELVESGDMSEAMDFMENYGLEPDYLEDIMP